MICFTHFIQKLDDLKDQDIIPDFIGRCAAGQFKKNYEGSDLFIPVVMKDNQISYIIIQIKNRKEIDQGNF